MKRVKEMMLMLLCSFGMLVVKGQTNEVLKGKWQSSYSEEMELAYLTYEFKEVDGELKAYTILIKDQQGNAHELNELTMDNIRLEDGKGESKFYFEHEGETYEMDAELTLTNEHTLHIEYSFWGFSDSETWHLIQ